MSVRLAVSRVTRRFAPCRAFAAVAVALLAACSSSKDSDDTDLESAFTVIGQSSFTASASNGGSTGASAATLNSPLGNVASNGSVMFIADTANNRVLGYNSVPSSNGASADFVLGQSDFSGKDSATTASGMSAPVSVFISSDNQLVVADSQNNRVLIWKTLPTHSGQAADVVVGQTSFTTRLSATTQTGLNYPAAAIIAGNQLLVADRNNNRVLIWDEVPAAGSNGAAADLVLGQTGFTTSVHDDEEYSLYNPSSLWSDGYKLLVSDTSNNRVLYWSNFPQDIGASATYVIGQTDFSRSTAGTSASTLRSPFGITSDGSAFYIADQGNNRVLRFDSLPIANNASASYVYGQDSDTFTAATANDEDQDSVKDDNPTEKTLNGPSGVHVAAGVLYVTDRSNNRVLLFAP